jgi:hypothetical protein
MRHPAIEYTVTRIDGEESRLDWLNAMGQIHE